MRNSCVMHRHTGPAPSIMVWGGIGYYSRTPLVRIAGTLNCQHYISEVLRQSPVLIASLASSLSGSFADRNMWSMVDQRLPQITPPAATPDQLWQRVEAAWSAVPQEHIQSLFESMLNCVAIVVSNNCGYSGY
ncbi:transposable element Tcb1 transposase [Trichonephila clavipes]|nr:transposable element Tcb1 transposase [Trichonephila clavipes]